MSDETIQCAFRLPTKMVARLDRHTKRMMRAAPGLTFSRTDAVRALLAQALDLVEAEEKGGES